MRKYMVAAVQMDTQNEKSVNWEQMAAYIDEAAGKGAKLVAFPEVVNILSEEPEFAEQIPGPTTDLLMRKAKEHRIWIHGGSISEVNLDGPRTYNTTVLINPEGEIVARYSKLHNFDMTLPDGSSVRESDRKEPGKTITTIETELGHLGFAICYDMRFPELFRLMTLQGAQIIFLPANFTMPTGKDHWEPILRARAIENGCYIIAPNQVGVKEKFVAYGNSMVIDPWGTVIARASDKPGLILAEIDLDYLDAVRRRNPSVQNRRTDVYNLQ
ncbi:MAG: carbon-nitrogen hydrolase family protein [Peptococcaceae bacterium]|nr:carbon-nitrogen hydrolase family protein [Peptococcaceae bacterium]